MPALSSTSSSAAGWKYTDRGIRSGIDHECGGGPRSKAPHALSPNLDHELELRFHRAKPVQNPRPRRHRGSQSGNRRAQLLRREATSMPAKAVRLHRRPCLNCTVYRRPNASVRRAVVRIDAMMARNRLALTVPAPNVPAGCADRLTRKTGAHRPGVGNVLIRNYDSGIQIRKCAEDVSTTTVHRRLDVRRIYGRSPTTHVYSSALTRVTPPKPDGPAHHCLPLLTSIHPT